MTVIVYRMNDGDESGVDDLDDLNDDQRIDFNFSEDSGSAVPDALSGLVSFSAEIGRHRAENPLPHTDVVDKPDTGFAGDQYVLNVLFNAESGQPLAIDRLMKWMSAPQVIDGKFDEGRIGITNPFLPELDLRPSGDAGYKLASFRPSLDLNAPLHIPCTIILEFSGDPSKLGSSTERLEYP